MEFFLFLLLNLFCRTRIVFAENDCLFVFDMKIPLFIFILLFFVSHFLTTLLCCHRVFLWFQKMKFLCFFNFFYIWIDSFDEENLEKKNKFYKYSKEFFCFWKSWFYFIFFINYFFFVHKDETVSDCNYINNNSLIQI